MPNQDYETGYSRGYNAGSKGSWPEHRPPAPPDPIIAKLVEALRELRDGADSIVATIDEEDEWAVVLIPLIDRADDALIEVGQWLKREGSGVTRHLKDSP